MAASVTTNRIIHVSAPPILNTAEMSNIVGQYLTDNTEVMPEVLKELNVAFSSGTMGQSVCLLTPDEVFFGLGENAWKDIMDGKHHGLGRLGFDKDRPGHPGEPGFYQGITSACGMASEILFEPSLIPTVATYKKIHRCACEHFRGTGGDVGGDTTLVHGSRTGQFLMVPLKSCEGNYEDLFIGDPVTSLSISAGRQRWFALRKANRSWGGMPTNEIIAICASNGIAWNYNSLANQEQCNIRKQYGLPAEGPLDNKLLDLLTRAVLTHTSQKLEKEAEKRWDHDFGPIVNAKIDEINADIAKRSAALGIMDANGKPVQLAHIMDSGSGIRIVYTCPPNLFETVVERIFEHFRRDIAAATSKAERRRCIANLYQMLEWVHAFPDGQGRTDLIMLKTLLVAHGLTPAILDKPYVSTFSSLDVWDTYLEHGMEKWELEFASSKSDPGDQKSNLKGSIISK